VGNHRLHIGLNHIRALQGLGAGIGIALAFVVVADIFPPAEYAKWQSLFGVVYGFANLEFERSHDVMLSEAKHLSQG
jgi:hypothetical protein